MSPQWTSELPIPPSSQFQTRITPTDAWKDYQRRVAVMSLADTESLLHLKRGVQRSERNKLRNLTPLSILFALRAEIYNPRAQEQAHHLDRQQSAILSPFLFFYTKERASSEPDYVLRQIDLSAVTDTDYKWVS